MREFDDSRVRLPVRSRIIDRLIEETGGAAGSRRLTVVCAPSGYGKTRTILGWLGDGNDPNDGVQWLSCTPSPRQVDTEAVFWRAIAQKLGATLPDDSQRHPSLENEDPEDWATLLTAQLTRPTILVIDNYHLVTNAATDVAIAHLAGVSPLLTLVVIGRRVTLLDRPFVSAKTRVRLIGPSDLALTATEAPELAATFGIPASEQLLATLRRADGWPLAIRAALNLGSDQLYLGSSNERQWNTGERGENTFNPAANLETFALDSLTIIQPHSRQVVLAAAVLDAISPQQMQQAFALTAEQADAAVHELLESGLLVEIVEADQAEYRCHKSVRQALRAYAVRTVDRAQLQALYRIRASSVADAAPFTAFRLFCASEDFAPAEELLARNFTTITDEAEVSGQILRSLPEPVLVAHPTFAAALLFLEMPRTEVAPTTLSYLVALWAQGVSTQWPDEDAEPSNTLQLALLCQAMVVARLAGQSDRANALMQRLESRMTSSYQETNREFGVTESARTLLNISGSLPSYYHEAASTALAVGDFVQARRSLERLRQHTERMAARPWSGFSYASTRTVSDIESSNRWRLTALGELAFTEMIDGNMHRSAELLAQMDAHSAATGVSAPGISWVGSAIARAHLSYETGDESLLMQAVADLSPIVDRMEGWQLLLIAEVTALRATHGSEWALSHLEAGAASNENSSQPYNKWSEMLRSHQAMLCSTIGDLSRSATILQSCAHASPRVRLELARLALFSGNDVEALLAAQQIGDPGTTVRQQLDRSLIMAVAAWGCGRSDEAFHSLSRAAWLLKQHGTPSVLRQVPHDLLREVAVAAQAAGASDLVAVIDAVPEPARSRRYERLTDMELRTLGAIAEHRNAGQAAAALYITAGTVKKHLAAVYRKLRVNGRDEAILQAGRMGLLRQSSDPISPMPTE